MALGGCTAYCPGVEFHTQRSPMGSLLYIQLIGYTAGTLLQLFWMVVILGYRRQRNFERVFFFLCLALFPFYGGFVLALKAPVPHSAPPLSLRGLADELVFP